MSHISESALHIYFHNLAFDGTFILDWLLKRGYKWTENPGVGIYFMISRMGKCYSVQLFSKQGFRVEFRDSFKKLPMSIREAIAKAFNLHDQKLEIDYET